jgi:hypothetical protein
MDEDHNILSQTGFQDSKSGALPLFKPVQSLQNRKCFLKRIIFIVGDRIGYCRHDAKEFVLFG